MRTRFAGFGVAILFLLPLAASALGTAFSYQGRLIQAGAAPTGSYDFQFALYTALGGGSQVGSTVTLSGVAVANGLFTVSLDFGAPPFAGEDRWLAIAARKAGSGSYVPLPPRQPLRPAPYALFARSVNWADILGRPAAFWTQGGNAFGAAGVLGTTDTYPLEILVGNGRAVRLEPNSTSPNIIMGWQGNAASAGSMGNFIGGGGNTANINQTTGSYGAIGGGVNNQVTSWWGFIGCGGTNLVSGTAGAIGGGLQNTASDFYTAIGGGALNTAGGYTSTVAGGYQNAVSGTYGAIGGGRENSVTGSYGTIPGGFQCAATTNGFAAGRRAKATASGSFVLADGQDADITAPTTNHVSIRAQNGIWLGTTSSPTIPAGRFLNTSTGGYLSSTGTWTNASDRRLKTGFTAIQGGDILRALSALPITEWRYKAGNETERHLGPTAQDFRAAFGLGLDDVSISTVDGIGVALAAVQALQVELRARDAAIARQQQEIDRLRADLDDLKQLIRARTDDGRDGTLPPSAH